MIVSRTVRIALSMSVDITGDLVLEMVRVVDVEGLIKGLVGDLEGVLGGGSEA